MEYCLESGPWAASWFAPGKAADVEAAGRRERKNEDLELVLRLQNRDPRAMADLYDRYGRMVFAQTVRIVRDTGIGEDIVQETFLRIWNSVQGFHPERGHLAGWVLAVARNRAIDYLRSRQGRMAHGACELDLAVQASSCPDIESDVLRLDQIRAMREALERLSSNQRTVLRLAYDEGLSQSEMAERLNRPIGTIKTWVRGALQTLRAEMD
jgi:RNA polymerase sigma-70 factor (ECF subfamily)